MEFKAMSHRKQIGGTNRLAQLMAENLSVPRNYEIKAEDDEATIYLFDGIGGWFGVEAKDFVKELSGIKASTINLRLNCPGGDVMDARAMQVALRQHKAKVIAHVDGLAASAATFLAMAADEIRMAKGAKWMVHRGWSLQIGNCNDMRDTADLLEGIDKDIASDYSKKTKKPWEDMIALMDAETWMSGDEALEAGFVDSVFDPAEPVENRWNLEAFDNAPADFPQASAETDDPDPSEQPSFEDLVKRMEAAADIMTRNIDKAADEILEEIPEPLSDEPAVARTMANRARRLRLLERELA